MQINEITLKEMGAARAGKYICMRIPYAKAKAFLTELEYHDFVKHGAKYFTQMQIDEMHDRVKKEYEAVFDYRSRNAQGPRVTFEDPSNGTPRCVNQANPGFEWVWGKELENAGTSLVLRAVDPHDRISWGEYAEAEWIRNGGGY